MPSHFILSKKLRLMFFFANVFAYKTSKYTHLIFVNNRFNTVAFILSKKLKLNVLLS